MDMENKFSQPLNSVGMPVACIVISKAILSKHSKCCDLVTAISKHFCCLGAKMLAIFFNRTR